MRQVLDIAKALSDGSRLRVLLALRAGEMCVCQIIELLELAPSTVSKHLAVLHQAGLIEARKDGRWVYYRLAGPDAPPAAEKALEWLGQVLAGDRQAEQDLQRVRQIRGAELETLCGAYHKGCTNKE